MGRGPVRPFSTCLRVWSRTASRLLPIRAAFFVVACVDGFTDEGDMIGEARPVGFVTIREEIRSSAAETIRWLFCEQGVTLNVISGDDPRTVASIARVVEFPARGSSSMPPRSTRPPRSMLPWTVITFLAASPCSRSARARGRVEEARAYGGHDRRRGQRRARAQRGRLLGAAMAAGSDAARNVARSSWSITTSASMPAVGAEAGDPSTTCSAPPRSSSPKPCSPWAWRRCASLFPRIPSSPSP